LGGVEPGSIRVTGRCFRSLARTASRIIVPIVTAAFMPVTPRSSMMST
jgi:hypothetical protein